ncbi:MAG: XylR N-terminal domain-containing protein, partial [Desulfotomaculaceae bacterium]|nr:XylR N-terminal domain-containing protein [Desulfotomaculaceae bacterium]
MSQEIQMAGMLKLQAGLGKNYLKDKRVLILNASAIGILRKDLIYTLGKEKAKGFLIRFGFNNGFRDVENLMSDVPQIDKEGKYHLARLFHTFIGMANVTSTERNINEVEHTWICEGGWHDSYEAEHHLEHFGPATEPVCWTLVGYASGIMSAFFGERVIIKEVSCAAMGDQYCRYVGMKLSDWGEEIRPELQYYHGTTLGQGIEWPQASIMEQNEALRQSVAVHEQLTKMVLNGDDISTITSAVGKIMNGTVMVEDQSFQPISYFSPTISTEINRQPPFSTKEIIGDWRLRHLAVKLTQENKPVILPSELTKRAVNQFLYPVVNKMEVLGYVSILKTARKLTEHELTTMEFVVTVFALKMMQDRTVAKTETRLLGDFVKELISGNFRTEASIIERARCFGYNIIRSHRVLVA